MDGSHIIAKIFYTAKLAFTVFVYKGSFFSLYSLYSSKGKNNPHQCKLILFLLDATLAIFLKRLYN